MNKPKFKKGDVCIVFKKNTSSPDEGSELRNDFKIRNVEVGDNKYQNLYRPTDGKRGAYEEQLRLRIQTLKDLIK